MLLYEEMERIDEVIRNTDDLDDLMREVLSTVLSVLKSDRAFLLFPCDPDSPSWTVPMECTTPEYPGAKVLNVDNPMTDDVAEAMRTCLEQSGQYVDLTPHSVKGQFSIQTTISMSIYPKVGEPWVFGLHQCSHQRAWTEEEKRLFTMIGRRISDGLGSLLMLRDLKKSEERYRHIAEILEATTDFVSSARPDGSLLYVNKAGRIMSGIGNKEALATESLLKFHTPESAKKVVEEALPIAKKDGEWIGETELIFRDGSVVPASQKIMAHRQEDGQIAHYSTIIRDISEKKKAHDDLRRLRNLLSKTVDSMPSILVGVDAKGCVTQWNKEAQCFTGVSSRQAMGRLLAEVFPELADQMDKIEESMHESRPMKEQRISLNNRIMDITIYPLVMEETDTHAQGAVIRIDDVTERVSMEEMVVQSEKMFSVGELAAGMAHEINNPLAGILQSVQLIQSRLSCDSPKNIECAKQCGVSMDLICKYVEKRDINRMMELVVDSGGRAAKIVKNMLLFSRKSNVSSTGTATMEMNDLSMLMNGAVELVSNDYNLSTKYDFKKIEIVKEYSKDGSSVLCDGNSILQVFLNLLKNGADAMAQTAEPSKFRIGITSDGEFVKVEVEDNGPGMTDDVRRRVFEPFFTTKSTGQGTGLGLAVSYFIVVESHEGTMSVDSSPLKGTTFTIRLPQ